MGRKDTEAFGTSCFALPTFFPLRWGSIGPEVLPPGLILTNKRIYYYNAMGTKMETHLDFVRAVPLFSLPCQTCLRGGAQNTHV